METDVLIIGAGLAGLSASFHLDSTDHVIVEAESQIGGLCKTFVSDGFHFDCTGHLIHFRTDEGRKIVTGLLNHKIADHQRRAAIFLAGCYTNYPFQANTYGLPPEIVRECLLGFVETLGKKRKRIGNFHDWIYDTFGSGIAKYFMTPYNEKLWQHDLRDIALDWVGWSIPKPTLEDVVNGALGIRNKQFGYNPVFYYPIEGGIGILPNSFPVRGKLMLQNPITRISLKRRTATLSNGEKVSYRKVFSTMPLHAFIKVVEDAPAFFGSALTQLEYVSVLNINLGIDRENVLPYHWVYFPEKDKPFYRVGSPSNFSKKVAPAGTSSLFVEVSLRPDQPHDVAELTKQSIQALRNCGILRHEDKVVQVLPLVLPYAYVIYNKARRRVVKRIQSYLEQRGVFSFGRYGSWIYSSMEDAVLQGKQYAQQLNGDEV